MVCPSCGTASENGQKFCPQCGTRLARVCSACGAANAPTYRFCGECGSALGDPTGPAAFSATAPAGNAPPAPSGPAPNLPATVAERRVVTVLFADLVGFTGLAEDRDPEAVRELLTRYFERARETIERYGGTVEKFIGDAVMAVWGAPIAREDDAERAVRAALEFVDVVRGLRPSAEGDEILARAAVLTGEAAVTLGATGQGMVAGDLVNTASRLQSVAPPGGVLVGESTHAATAEAIAYERAGEHVLKGKAAPVAAWRAMRVVAKLGGVARAEGLEPPYVGRDAQLRLLKDFLHSTASEGRLRFVSVTGQAGTGKSRLTWEFHKYIDGLVDDVFWHQGRSPAYGEGVTFWALGEMVRKRAGLAEDDDSATTRAKIRAALEEYVPDEEERRWIEPTLLGLLGLEEVRTVEREELFAAWRTFFERVSDRGVTVLVFEDVHWADQGLIDFIDHLAEWSTEHPILLLTLARAEFLETHREWGAGRRNFVALSLDPLPDEAMGELLAGLVPGLPDAARQAILERAEGIPLYAVEMVRKLLVDGRLERVGDAYRPVDDLARLEIPDTLHALIAARLDSLDPAERSLLHNAAILGQTFSVAALAAVSGSPAEAIEPLLRDLVRREVLAHNRDPRSPERGQYGFVQALIREVAYATLSRRDRRSRHLAAARYFEALGDDELAGVLAMHYLDAFQASDEGPEAGAIAAQARIALRAAAERALALHSPEQALSYVDAALQVTREPLQRGLLHELAGSAARGAARSDLARQHYRRALDELTTAGDGRGILRATAAIGTVAATDGQAHDAIALLEPAVATLGELADTPEGIALVSTLARSYLFADDYARAIEASDRALIAAEAIDDIALITEAVLTKGTTLAFTSRHREALVLLSGALQLAETNGFVASELRARLNISFLQLSDDPRQSFASAYAGVERARRLGLRNWTFLLTGNASSAAFALGDWDFPVHAAEELAPADVTLSGTDASELVGVSMIIQALRGDRGSAGGVDRFDELVANTTTTQEQTTYALVHAWLEVSRGRFADALAHDVGGTDPAISLLFYVPATHAALWLRDLSESRSLLERITATGLHGRWVTALGQAVAAGIAALEGRLPEAEVGWTASLTAFREIGAVRDVALVEMDRAALAEPAVAQAAAGAARELLLSLGATAALQLLEQIGAQWAPIREPATDDARALSR
ncbi:MAG: AAA family ATPase [Chloroflexi bacterium]|nr:AAA family ATPase [Chloroflexota bacterium]